MEQQSMELEVNLDGLTPYSLYTRDSNSSTLLVLSTIGSHEVLLEVTTGDRHMPVVAYSNHKEAAERAIEHFLINIRNRLGSAEYKTIKVEKSIVEADDLEITNRLTDHFLKSYDSKLLTYYGNSIANIHNGLGVEKLTAGQVVLNPMEGDTSARLILRRFGMNIRYEPFKEKFTIDSVELPSIVNYSNKDVTVAGYKVIAIESANKVTQGMAYGVIVDLEDGWKILSDVSNALTMNIRVIIILDNGTHRKYPRVRFLEALDYIDKSLGKRK